VSFVLALSLAQGTGSELVHAGDAATEALSLRLHAELAIAQEARLGDPELAGIMEELLPDLLLEHLHTRDGSIALDTVDAAFVEEQLKIAHVMEEPGVAMALDVFAGPGTGYEHGMRTAMANLAGFHLESAQHASEIAAEAYEQAIEDWETKREEIKAHLDSIRLDAKLGASVDRISVKAAQKVERVEQKASEKVDQVAEKIVEKLEQVSTQVTTVVEQRSEQAAAQVQQALDTAVEKVTEAVGQKADPVVTPTPPDQTQSTPAPSPPDKGSKGKGGK
jgi:hypothetical protein